MNGIDLSKIVKAEYAGKWVALSEDYKTLFGAADSLKELQSKVPQSNKVVYTKVLDPNVTYAF